MRNSFLSGPLLATVIGALFLLLGTTLQTAHGIGIISMGKLSKISVHPHAGYSLIYNDNIFLDEDDAESDFIHRFSFGGSLLYADTPADPGEFLTPQDWMQATTAQSTKYALLTGNLDLNRYMDNTDTNYEAISAGFQAGYRSPSGYYVTFSDTFLRTEDQFGAENRFQEGENTRRWTNAAELAAGYAFTTRFRTELAYRNFIIEYDEFRDQWQDRMDNVFSATGFYRFWPKTSALVEYRFTDKHFPEQQSAGDNNLSITDDTSQDNQLHQVFAGLSFDPTAKIQGDVRLGVAYKDYENDTNWRGDEYDDITTWSMEGRLTSDFLEKTRLSAVLFRGIFESTESYATHYVDTRVNIGLSHELVQDFCFASASLGYGRSSYEVVSGSRDRDDDIYQGQLGLQLLLKSWLLMDMGYQYQRRDSSYPDESYTNNMANVGLKASF